ncbi:hypothetical protein KZ483_09835 [Paenibacillus sp. sptzw28]|uniref:hypothetical protein n=1 Tax=Paenibacillus sp. sptzw28 TaxID=715179 RepID=UPI001C6DE0D6|nr:hypothetical protein [Paenibacillus sp. sptzw28]QYR23187.1 hypothetical protein KZ483_09835 [Paenibacillus sp. sptzw28]
MKTILPRKSKTVTLAVLAALTFSIQAEITAAASAYAGKSAASMTVNSALGDADSAKMTAHYEALLKKGRLPEAIAYLSAHIGEVSSYPAMIMVLQLENAVKKALPSMDQQFAKTSVQESINKVYKFGDSFSDVMSRSKDSSLKSLLKEADASGYKLETAEGYFFPVINYAAFQKFRPYVTDDIQAYIDIMTVESNKASVKDAGLVIGYQELVNRALTQERFVQQFPNSNRTVQVRSLFDRYKIYTFYGTNNTPLFDYESKKMQPNAIKGYTALLQYTKNGNSPYLNLLRKFMNLAADNNYKLTSEVEKYRTINVPVK